MGRPMGGPGVGPMQGQPNINMNMMNIGDPNYNGGMQPQYQQQYGNTVMNMTGIGKKVLPDVNSVNSSSSFSFMADGSKSKADQSFNFVDDFMKAGTKK